MLRVISEAIAAIDPDPEGETDTLEELVDAYLGFFHTEPVLARIFVRIAISGSAGNDGIGARMLHGHQTRVERFRVAMQRDHDMAEKEAEVRAELLLAVLNGLAFRWSLDTDFDFDRYAGLALAETLAAPIA